MTLLAAYNFDEASGAILDRSGNGRDVAFGGSLTRVTGHTNTALSQSTTAVDSAGPALTGMQTAAYTIMGWVRRTSNSQDGWLLEFKQASSGDRGLLFTAGNIQSRCKNVAGSVFTVQTTQPVAGTAYHFACTNDGTTLRLFINGSEVGTGTAFSGGVRTNSTSSSFVDGLGAETYLDDARYYDTALNAATITSLMNTPVVSGGGSNNTPAGPATETDTGQTLGRTRTRATGTATETDTGQAVGRTRVAVAGPAQETDTAVAVSSAHLTPAGPATETDQALSAARTRLTTLGVAVETDTAPTTARTRATALQPAQEIDTPMPVGSPNAVTRDLELTAVIEPVRFTIHLELSRFRTEINAP